MAISPDGRRLVFLATGTEESLASGSGRSTRSCPAAPRNGGGAEPFWSPDGRIRRLLRRRQVEEVDARRRRRFDLCDAAKGRGGSVERGRRHPLRAGVYSPIYRVPAAGGDPRGHEARFDARGDDRTVGHSSCPTAATFSTSLRRSGVGATR